MHEELTRVKKQFMNCGYPEGYILDRINKTVEKLLCTSPTEGPSSGDKEMPRGYCLAYAIGW